MQRMAQYHRAADSTVSTINQAYDKAIRDIRAEIDKIFYTFGKNGQMDPAQARKVLNQQIPNPLLSFAKRMYPRVRSERIRRWMLNRMNAPAYRARITRLQALKEQVYLQSKMIADAEITASTAGYVRTINEAYYRTMFDLQKGIGVGFEFAAMPARVIETILKRPWSGEHYSSRIWDNTDALARLLNEVLTGGFMSGTGVRKMVEELLERTEVGKHSANRLVRTETTYMANAAELESYEEAEIDRYRFVATLDNLTSPQCRSHDLKVYQVSEAVPGKNMPPLHPFCRSTTAAVIGDDTTRSVQRRARDPETGKTMLVPANMSYEQWKKTYGGEPT
jgi:SPP1 gp7 family putative phage head morphogenesis protein